MGREKRKIHTDDFSLIRAESGDKYMGVHYNIPYTSVLVFKKFIFCNLSLVMQ